MIKDITIALFILVTLLSSCKEEKPSTEQLLKEIKEFERNISEQEDPISFWKNLLKQKRYASNRVAKSSINTMIGVGFYRSNLDSAEVYGTKALVLIEDLEGFEREKIVVYNNLGNIANVKGKSFLSSFYYYRIISILEANPSKAVLRLERKVQSYLNSANANINLNLEESAYNLTRVAASYVDSLSKGDYGNYLRFRIYSQLFSSSYNLKKNTDSLSYYLEKQEQFLISPEAKRFHYLQKAYFFDLNNQFDSAKVYYQKCLIIDQNERKDNVTTPINEYVAYCDLLQNSINRGNINEADSLIDKLNEMRQDISLNLPDLTHVDFWEAMMNYHYKFKNFEEYHEATEKVLELIQEIHKEAELQAKEEMHAMYQLEENKKAIKELNQDVEVKENQLQQTQFLLIITTLGILVALAILALFYYRQKNQKLQQEYEKVVLEQKLLRTQMEPHFIFNTLSTLQSLIRFQEPKIAIDYLNKFSRLLRSNLELSRKELISLEDEIETIQNYLQLQQARFKEHFTYQIQTPDELEIDALLIPPMLIQPFVENSILHGFDGESEWHIEIKITEQESTSQLKIDIIDNGVGIHENSNKKHKSLSGEIAKERLEILSKKYKVPTEYQIFSEHAKGTTVSLKLPIIDMSNS